MRGFTLLEVLVVLVLLGLAAGLVAPSLARTLERVSEAGDRDQVLRAVQALPIKARHEGRRLSWAKGAPLAIPSVSWPDGWRVTALQPLTVRASGWCRTATIDVESPSGHEVWTVRSPDCRVDVAHDD